MYWQIKVNDPKAVWAFVEWVTKEGGPRPEDRVEQIL
jgi:hypothetical protein